MRKSSREKAACIAITPDYHRPLSPIYNFSLSPSTQISQCFSDSCFLTPCLSNFSPLSLLRFFWWYYWNYLISCQSSEVEDLNTFFVFLSKILKESVTALVFRADLAVFKNSKKHLFIKDSNAVLSIAFIKYFLY